jgi:hypothetical protein
MEKKNHPSESEVPLIRTAGRAGNPVGRSINKSSDDIGIPLGFPGDSCGFC